MLPYSILQSLTKLTDFRLPSLSKSSYHDQQTDLDIDILWQHFDQEITVCLLEVAHPLLT